jgi:hypothetical protein
MITTNKRSRKRSPPGRVKNKHKARRPTGQRTSVQLGLDERTRDAIIRLAEAFQRSNKRSERDYLETYAQDPIPENAIGFRDAFYRIWDAADKDPKRLSLDDDEREEIRTRTEADLKQFVGDDYPREDVDMLAQGKEANLFLRKCITEAELVACVRDPETGEILQLQRSGWDIAEFYPGECGFVLYNHVHPDDVLNPGPPDVIIRGMARPVFFLRDAFDTWFKKVFNPIRPGRKRGSGSYELADRPLLLKMRSLIETGQASGVEDAAWQEAKYAVGNSLEASKQVRLAKRYRAWARANFISL